MQIENIWYCKLDKENAEKIVSVIKEIVSIEFNITVPCPVKRKTFVALAFVH